jgi:protein tyrosine phosphatase (PTP) superfamily phosphohydrolase (DUF442 family)
MEQTMSKLTGIFNYLEIGGRLGTAGQPLRDEFDSIAAAGYEMVINLALPTSENALADEEDIVTRLGMVYVHIPVVWEAPKTSDFERFCEVMQEASEKKVFVHCVMNMRVSAFVFLYRVLYDQVHPELAEQEMLQIWEPDDVWAAFIEHHLPPEQI